MVMSAIVLVHSKMRRSMIMLLALKVLKTYSREQIIFSPLDYEAGKSDHRFQIPEVQTIWFHPAAPESSVISKRRVDSPLFSLEFSDIPDVSERRKSESLDVSSDRQARFV